MADQRKNDVSPIGLGLTLDSEPNASEPQHDASERPREVEDLTDENFDDFDPDFTDDVEHRAEPLRVIVDHAPADAHEVDSQPGSAFSSSSSEGDEDVEEKNEVEEQDENDTDFEHGEEWHDVDTSDQVPPLPVEPQPVHQAIHGVTDDDEIDHIYRVDYRSGRCSPLHRGTGLNSKQFRAKMNDYSRRPSKRQKVLTSPPVSPEYNTGSPAGMGVIAEPSPEAEEDDHIVSPLSEHEASEPALEQQASATKRVWSEADEEDTSWVSGAIAEVTGSRRGSAESFTADLPEQGTGDASIPESSDDAPLSPVSPLDKAGALDALRDDSDSDVEDDVATPRETPGQHPESSGENATVPIVDDPVSGTPPPHTRDPTSPDFEGPELLTGLTPKEGITLWWQWHDQLGNPAFSINRNPYNQDESGDFKYTIDSSGKDEAAAVLSKQRFLLNRMTSREVRSISNAMSDVERTLEYMKLQMLKYRHQRNEYRLDADYLEAKVDRRDVTIKKLDDRIARRENTIQENQEELNLARKGFFKVVEDARELGVEKEKYYEAAKAMHAQKQTAEEAVEAMRAEKEKFAKMLEQKIDEAQLELDDRKKPLEFASIMTVISQEPIAGEEELADRASEKVDHHTTTQVQAEVNELRTQLQKLTNIESELVACKSDGAQLRSHRDELEDELRNLAMTRRANAGSDSDLTDRMEAADAFAQGHRAEIERLQGESVAWQTYADNSIAMIQAELDAAHEEVSALKEALLEHGWSAYAPSRKNTVPLMSDQGTQTETRAPPSALLRSPVKAVPAPLKASKRQQIHKEAPDQPSSWASRREAIMQSPSAAAELESRRVAREKRQAAELERLDRIRQSMDAIFKLDGLSYAPLEAGRVAVAA
ncbi:hypothetical protein MBLNU13_g10048t1 [Cladosporium sp. NU13]